MKNLKLTSFNKVSIAFGLLIIVLTSYALIFGKVSYLSSTYLG